MSHHCLLLATASLADISFTSVFIYLIAVYWLYNTEAKCHMVCKCLSSHVDNPPLYRDKKQLPEKILKPVASLWHFLPIESTLARHSCASHTFASLPFVLGSYGKRGRGGKVALYFCSALLASFLPSSSCLCMSSFLLFFSSPFLFSFSFFLFF